MPGNLGDVVNRYAGWHPEAIATIIRTFVETAARILKLDRHVVVRRVIAVPPHGGLETSSSNPLPDKTDEGRKVAFCI
jgi:hypothetical protein